MNRVFLTKLLESVSVSGHEEAIQSVVKEEMKGYADQIIQDEMQNTVCVLNPENETRIMLSAHADEIGLIISNICDNGRLQVIARGGIVPSTYPGQRVKVVNEKGIVYGAIEARRELFKIEDLGTKHFLVDIGAKSKEDALEHVSLGDPIVLDTNICKLLNHKFTARALDDRIGVYVIMEALKRAKERNINIGVYAASTVGEETTKNGAYWTSSRIKPSLAIVVDVTYTSDYSGMDPAEMGTVLLGSGPVLCNSPIVSKKLNQKMAECAKKANIPIQWEAASRLSYTDADQIHFSNEGVPVVLVSLPLRYMHMPAEVADENDLENSIELIAQFLSEYH